MLQYHLSVLSLTIFLAISGPWVVAADQTRPCPKYCPKSNEPVCGSDQVIYSNECFLHKSNCDGDAVVADPEVCTRAKGSLCENHCNSEEDLVCGSDGRTYLNTCVMMVEECRRGIRLAHMGPCANETVAAEEECPKTCGGAPADGPICASNGNVYPSRCTLKQQTCKQGVVETKEKHCLLTKHSKDSCWRASKAVCGSNGQIYASSCLLRKQSSLTGKHVFEVPMTYCAPQERSATNCASDCQEDEKASPVCGSDGNIYSSLCQMRKLNCLGQANGKVIQVDWLRCAAKAMRCAEITCSSNATQDSSELFCGNDGQTYTDCELKVASCRRSTELAHLGPCTNLTLEETASCVAISCPEDVQDDEPICASDGNVYRSLCEMKRQSCGQRVIPVARKHCLMTKYCGQSCSKKSQSVCGSDLKIYRNMCNMFANNCGKFVYEVPMKRCLAVAGFRFTSCNRICSTEYDPVCGSDNKTYSNVCFLELEHCRSRSLVTKKHYGKCGEPVPEPKAYLY